MCVMDSKAFQSTPITKTTELQLAKIYSPSPSKSSLRVEIASVQQQQGLHDCGLFAIAYATEICLGRKPDEAQFDQNLMRQHLKKILNEKNFKRFPMSKHGVIIPRPSCCVKNIELYCICHMPESFDVKMIACDDCNNWYHFSCVLYSDSEPETWKCLDKQ